MRQTLDRIRAARQAVRAVLAGAPGDTVFLGSARAWVSFRPVVVGGAAPTLRLGRCEGRLARALAPIRAARWALRHRRVWAETCGAWRAPEGHVEVDLGTLSSRRAAPCVLAERGERAGWDLVRECEVAPCGHVHVVRPEAWDR